MIELFKGKKSKEIAKERLTLVLSYERKRLPTNLIERIKEDIVKVLSSYGIFDVNTLQVKVKRENSKELIFISIPIKG